MKHCIRGLLLVTALVLPLHSHAASFNCAKAKTWSEKTVCNTKQLSSLDDLLAVSFKKALESTDDKAALKSAQVAWLTDERDVCEDIACLKAVYTARLAVLNEIIASAEESVTEPDSDDVSGGWYQAIAKPNLTVRKSADVTGKKLGNVPYGGKVKVLEFTDKTDSIGGRAGTWVKIEWQGKSAYAFDAFLEKLPVVDSDKADESHTTKASKTLEGLITSYECGDNCYLVITDKQGEQHSGLCTATLCEPWNEVAEMPTKFQNQKVKVTVGTGTQYDGGGNVMGEMDAFETIKLLK